MKPSSRNTILLSYLIIALTSTSVLLNGCGDNRTPTPCDTEYLDNFHQLTNNVEIGTIDSGNLQLFVDYSTCIALGKNSQVYQSIVPSLTAATKTYWSIKGDTITREDVDVYRELNDVSEVNYAALDQAINQMADLDTESILLTDGELFVQTSTRDNPNNPYMHDAFKKWLLKGHDIHILAEPYVEQYKGQQYQKKRFYIIFTDDRLPGNIYDRISKTVDLSQFPQVDEYHLSANYPWYVPSDQRASKPNPSLAAEVTAMGDYEIQDWPLDWETIKQVIIANAYDAEGNPLENGEKIISGLRVNRNAFGAYRIKGINVKAYNINAEYQDIYERLANGEKVGSEKYELHEIPEFITYDKDEFDCHGNIDLYFDVEHFAPDTDTDLNGTPYNFIKIEITISEVENILTNHIDMFNFESIAHPGRTNVSISESLNQSVYDPEIIDSLNGKVLYTIYIKSDYYKD